MKSFAALLSAVVAVVPFVAADFIPAGSAAHFFSSQNSSLVFAPSAAASGASLVAALAGDGSSSDITALFPTAGTGVPGQIVYGDFCISANGVVPESSSQVLYVAECDPEDAAQIWTVNESPATVSNADGNCISLGRPARGVSVVLDVCNDVLLPHQIWNPKVVA
ncbi:hypothetical protein L226DRAFT_537214 [Lentinus tigrinus ALCF2SS1-7]|uniref:uncharacterized protein n=1 Tax=Lentinus tigrinus ALCF2SS1-7 TaxID=1328758 RepID=UPI001165CFC0|nr:hypothetical protein L226DRAFT_537214 [Lentinus tigrinus ALCF2SS1-7]